MTIEQIGGPENRTIFCQWFVDKALKNGSFSPDALFKVDEKADLQF